MESMTQAAKHLVAENVVHHLQGLIQCILLFRLLGEVVLPWRLVREHCLRELVSHAQGAQVSAGTFQRAGLAKKQCQKMVSWGSNLLLLAC
jgi:hypothetical protein